MKLNVVMALELDPLTLEQDFKNLLEEIIQLPNTSLAAFYTVLKEDEARIERKS